MIWPTARHKEFGEYIYNTCCEMDIGLLIKGSIANGTAGSFSDIDLTIYGTINKKAIEQIVFGFEAPLKICASEIPPGLLIIIYRKGIGIDLGIEKTIESVKCGKQIELFSPKKSVGHRDQDIEEYLKEIGRTDKYTKICKLLHKGILKYSNGKIKESKEFIEEIKYFTGVTIDAYATQIEAFQIIMNTFIKTGDEIKQEITWLIEKANTV